MRSSALISVALSSVLVLAQDMEIMGTTTSPQTFGYSCDPSKCHLPDCNCASVSPPGGLQPVSLLSTSKMGNASWTWTLSTEKKCWHTSQSDAPQFIIFTADDAIQSYTLDSINQFLAQRKNPNGCPIKMTYFTSLDYTNYTLVTGILLTIVHNLWLIVVFVSLQIGM